MEDIKAIHCWVGDREAYLEAGKDFVRLPTGEHFLVTAIIQEFTANGALECYKIEGKREKQFARIHADTAIVTYKEKKSMEDMSVKIEIDDKIITENIRSYMQNALHKATKEIKEKPSLILCNAIKADGENIPFKEE